MANDVKLTKKHPNYKNQDSNDHITASGNVKNTVTGLAGHDTFDGGKGQDTLVIKADWADAKITETADGFKIKIGSDWIKVTDVEKFKFNDGTFNEKTLINHAPTGTATFHPAGTEDTVLTINASDLLAGIKDSDKDALTVSGLTADNGATVVDNHDGTFTVTLAENFNGDLNLSYTVTDARGATLAASTTAAIAAVNDAPTVATPISDATASEGVAFSFAVPAGTFADVDGDTLTLSATLADGSALPAWLTFDPTTGTFSGTPTDGTAGTVSVKVTASDGTLSGSDTFDIVIADTIKTLTTKNDTLGLTSATETITGDSTTFNDGDLIIDTTSGDNDTLNVTLTATNALATVAGVENVNFTWDALSSAVIEADNIKGASITVSSTKFGFAGGLQVNDTGNNSVTAGTGVTGALDVNGATATTVNTGSATTVTVDGSATPANNTSAVINAGAAATSITVGAAAGFLSTSVTGGAATTTIAVSDSADVTIVGGAATTSVTVGDKGTTDKASITLSSDATVTAAGAETLNITEAAGKTITLGGAGLANNSTTTISSTGAVTLVATQAQLNIAGTTKLVNAATDLTLSLGTITAALDLTNIGFNTLDLGGPLVGALTVASGVTVVADAAELAGQLLQSTTGATDVLNLKLTGDNTIDAVGLTKSIETVHVATALTADTVLDVAVLDVGTATFSGADKIHVGATSAAAGALDFSAVTADVQADNLAANTGLTLTAIAVTGSATANNTIEFDGTAGESITYVGGAGNDSVTVQQATTAASSFTLGDGVNSFTANSIDDGASVAVAGGSGVDTVTLEFINTASAVAQVTAGGGNDIINVTYDNSALQSVSVSGGDGNDTVLLDATTGSTDNVIYDGGTGTDTLSLAAGTDITSGNIKLTGVEIINDVNADAIVNANLLSGQAFTIQAGTGSLANLLDVVVTATGTYNFGGLTLDNSIAHAVGGLSITSTSGGSDSVTATAGNDVINTSVGADIVVAGAGDDVITGGAAADTLTGGTGADTFIFTDATTKDTITDFTVADNDKLRFDISDLGLAGADYTAGTATIVTAAGGNALAAAAADKHIVVDTHANVLTMVDADSAWSGAAIAIETDTGNILYDADADFSTGSVIIGTITPAQAALIAAGNLDFVA